MKLSKKEESIIRTHDDPVLPKLTKILFWLMVILLAAMLLVDINAFIRYDHALGPAHLFYNVAVTGFFEWLILSVFLLPLSLLGCRENRRNFYRQKKESGIVSTTEREIARDRRAVRTLNETYLFYIRVSGIGLGVWFVLFLIAMML